MPDIVTAPPVAESAPASAPVSEAPITPEIVVDLSPEQRRAVLKESFEPAKESPKPAEVKEEKPPEVAPVVVDAVAAPASPADDDEEQPFKEGEKYRTRITTHNAKHAAFLKAFQVASAANPEVNPADVARLVGYDLPAAQEPAYQEPEIPRENPDVTGARATLDALDAQIEAIEDGALMTKDVKSLLKQRSDALAQLSEAKLRSEFAQQRQEDKKAERDRIGRGKQECKAEVIKEYPTVADDNSELGTELGRLLGQVENPRHPDNWRMSQADFPRWLTEQAATAAVKRLTTNLGLTEAQALSVVKTGKAEAVSPATPVQKQPATVPRTVLVTAPGGKSAPSATAMTPQQAIEAARSDPKIRRAALALSNGVTIS